MYPQKNDTVIYDLHCVRMIAGFFQSRQHIGGDGEHLLYYSEALSG